MIIATAVQALPILVLYVASFALVVWAVVDIARRPTSVMPRSHKAAWIISSVVGWFFLGLIGATVAIFYLVATRKRLNARTVV
jgi:hypothetical protein